MQNINILVFPCGSEVALEIHRSLRYSRFLTLFGANSVSDHGRFVFDNYSQNLPFVNDANFIPELKKLVKELKIDIIYPAMDAVISILKDNEQEIGCKVIGSPTSTTQICLSKAETYKTVANVIPVPKVYNTIQDIASYPAFMKPAIGYGSRGAKRINNKEEAEAQLKDYPTSIITEYLPGIEYTIDCFTDRLGHLHYAGGRKRQRISNGISVNTIPVDDVRFIQLANALNNKLHFRGAWFFQLKENEAGDFVLLEIASRMAGSSSLYRNKGVNFALLSIFDYMEMNVAIVENGYNIELDRALDNKYKLDIDYDTVYVDFDDCLIIKDSVNISLISFIYQAINDKKSIKLITKHSKDINESLAKYRLTSLFDEVIHIEQADNKYKYINAEKSIFIDDSHAERKAVADELHIPVFAPDMVESLLK